MATSSAMNTSNSRIKYTISVTQNSQSIANNTSNVTVNVRFYRTNTGYSSYGTGTVYCKINGTTYSAGVTPSQKITNSGIILFTKTLTIPHNADGTKTLVCSAWISHDVVTSSEQSYSQVLTTIPRASSLTASNGTLGTAQTLTINRASSSFTHTLTWVSGYSSGVLLTESSATTVSFTPRVDFASGNRAGTSVEVVFTLTTYSNGVSIGETKKTISCAIPSTVIPSISGVSITEASSAVPSGFPFVQGKSQLRINVTASGIYGSTIQSVKCTVGGVTYTGASITTNIIHTVGNVVVKTVVTDSRGRTATRNDTITVYSYEPPKATGKAIRCNSTGVEDDQGEYAKISYDVSALSLNNANAKEFKILYKKSSATSYTTITISATSYVTSGERIITADSGSSYDVIISAKDSFNETKMLLSLPTAHTILNISANGKGIKFGGVAERDGFEIEGQSFYVNGGSSMFNPTRVLNGTDLNELTDVGWYMQESNANTSNNVNAPEKVAFLLCVYKMTDTRLMQHFICLDGKASYWRYYRDWSPAAWLEWHQMTGEAVITEALSQALTGVNWSCKKYSDGTMEVSGGIDIANYACTTALGGWFRTNVISFTNYNASFISAPDVVMSFSTESGTGAMVWETTRGTATAPPNIYLIRPTSSNSVSGRVSIVAKGRWK